MSHQLKLQKQHFNNSFRTVGKARFFWKRYFTILGKVETNPDYEKDIIRVLMFSS